MTLRLSRQEAANELLLRRGIRRSLASWARYIEFEPAPHHRLIIAEIEALLTATDYDTLLLGAPPGSAKSSYVSIALPSWYIGRFPQNSILHASHSTTLAEKWGRKVRNLVGEHSARLGVKLSDDNKAAGRWSVEEGGEYFAAGVGVGISGFRADCVVGNTIVETLNGPQRIDSIGNATQACYVLSYERQIRKPVYRRVLAVARRHANELWRVRTASGRMVEATGDHLFYTDRGFSPASSLVVGDVLLRSMPSARASASGRSGEASTQADVLRGKLLNTDNKCCEGFRGLSALHGLWRSAFSGKTRNARLLFGVSFCGCDACECGSAEQGSAQKLRSVLGGFYSGEQGSAWALLLARLQGYGAFLAHCWFGQSKLAGWSESLQVSGGQWAKIQEGKESCAEAGSGLLRNVWQLFRSARSPHRQGQYEQHVAQRRHSLLNMPRQIACGGETETSADYVALVERVRQESDVYDIQVEETACFFANGILVHNCGIIDDPYGSREDADSETIREKIQDWFMADFSARLKPGAKRIVMATRWREDDLSGFIEAQAAKGKYRIRKLMLPAIAGANDPLGRKSGEYLWDEPNGYNYGGFLRARQMEVTPRDWSALYQQAPSPDEGLFFKKEMFRYYHELPKHLRFYGASDYAVTGGGGDYTVHVVIGIDPEDNFYLVDMWRQQTDSNIWVDAFCDLLGKYKPLMWAEEQGQIIKSLGPFIDKRMRERRTYGARKQFTSTSDKPTRAQSFQGRVAMGKVYFPETASWRADLEKELLSFPVGVNDDIVDALGLAGRLLDVMVGGTRPKETDKPVDRWKRAAQRAEAIDSDWKVA